MARDHQDYKENALNLMLCKKKIIRQKIPLKHSCENNLPPILRNTEK